MFFPKISGVREGDRARAESTYFRAEAHLAQGELDGALSLAHVARELYAGTNDVKGQARAHHLTGDVLMQIDQAGLAAQNYAQALRLARDPEDQATILVSLGRAHAAAEQRDEAVAAYGRALALFTRLGNADGMLEMTYHLAYLNYEREAWVEAERGYREALRLAEARGAAEIIDTILLELGNAIALQGRMEEARALFEASAAQARAEGDYGTLAVALHSLAVTYVYYGEVEQAIGLFRQSLGLKRRIGDRYGIAYTLYELGMLESSRGDCDRAEQLLEQSARIYEELGASEREVVEATVREYTWPCSPTALAA